MTFLPFTIWMLSVACCETSVCINRVESIKESSKIGGDTVPQIGHNIMVIYQDRKSNYWLGSWQDGLYRLDGKSIIHYTAKHGLPNDRVEEIKEDKLGNIFINTSKGLCKFDGRSFITIKESLLPQSEWRLTPDDLWFKSSKVGYVCRYDGKSLVSLEIPKSVVGEKYIATHPAVFNPYIVYCIYKDRKGNIWLGTSMFGVMRYDGRKFDWISEADVTEMHNGPANGVRSIAEDSDGNFWFNTDFKYRIKSSFTESVRLDEDATFYLRVKSIGSLDGKSNGHLNEFLSIVNDNNNHLWIALYKNGVWKYDGKKVAHFPILVNKKIIPIYCLFKDNSGNILLGTPENGLFKFNGATFEKFNL